MDSLTCPKCGGKSANCNRKEVGPPDRYVGEYTLHCKACGHSTHKTEYEAYIPGDMDYEYPDDDYPCPYCGLVHHWGGESGMSKPYTVIWHDYEDGTSHDAVIEVPEGKDPESAAYGYLQENVGMGNYLLESVEETKDRALKRWYIEVGPVLDRPGPGPGDGSDAAFETIHFLGNEAEAEEEAKHLCRKWEEKTGGYDPDRGHFGVGYSLREVPL